MMEKTMAPEDRDRNFEKALTRQLRSSAPRGAGESPSVKMAACPDAETLAAFHERSLLPEEWDRVNLHVAGCPHCMTLLAQLEATDAIHLEAHTAAESQARTLAAASASPAAAATSAQSRKPRRVLRLPGARWHYVVPAGALAAGLLVWVAIHENHSHDFAVKQSVQVAENQTPPPTAPPLSAPVPNASSEVKAKAPEPLTAHSELATRTPEANAGKSAAALDDLAKDKTLTARNDAGAALSEKESNLKKEGVREADRSAIRVQADAARDQKAAGGAVQQNADAMLQTQVQNNGQLQNQANSNQATGGPSAFGQATMNRAAAAKPAPVTNAAADTNAVPAARMAPAPQPQAPSKPGVAGAAASNYTSSGAMETVSGFANPRLITVPGSSFAWRVGRTGSIEFSRNDGSSWTRQSSGVTSDLITGSAPSDKTCWIVGRTGTILLTTDGGAHWKLLTSPMPDDLGGVAASDAVHARVWNSLNTKSFETSDGGVTWKRYVNE
jgi:hypothetical protein